MLREGGCYYVDEEAIAPLWRGQRFPLDACVSGLAMLNGEPIIIPDVYGDAGVPHDVYRPTFVKSMVMVVPVRKDNPIAAIGAYWNHAHAPTAEHARIQSLLAEAAAVRLSSDQLWARMKDVFER